ncbi:hypothetical protein AAVH_05744 [Aphelenchoides avenae]|nr:hypothetical protein AAVH_05744 [Aphelenchus avenae]
MGDFKDATEPCAVPHQRFQPMFRSDRPADPWEVYRTCHVSAYCPCGDKMSNGVRWCQWHRMSDDTRKAYMRDKRLRENYKTEMCRQQRDQGFCYYGNNCRFAHNDNELRPKMRHPKYKTQLCHNYARNGSCPYGANCQFQHRVPDASANGPVPLPRSTALSQFGKSFEGSMWTEDPDADSMRVNLSRSLMFTSTPIRSALRSEFSKSDGKRVAFAVTPERPHGTNPDGDKPSTSADNSKNAKESSVEMLSGAFTQLTFDSSMEWDEAPSERRTWSTGRGGFGQSLGVGFFKRQF